MDALVVHDVNQLRADLRAFGRFCDAVSLDALAVERFAVVLGLELEVFESVSVLWEEYRPQIC